MPNAIVLALSSNVQFCEVGGRMSTMASSQLDRLRYLCRPMRGQSLHGLSTGSNVHLPCGAARTAPSRFLSRRSLPTLLRCSVTSSFANNSKPLPSGLVTELLPEISEPISPRLSQRKLPSALVDQLNQAEESPLKGLIRRPSMSTSERKAAVITDTSLVKGLEEALRTPASCLFPYRNIASGETDIDGIWAVLICYWSAVRDVFPDAGYRRPRVD